MLDETLFASRSHTHPLSKRSEKRDNGSSTLTEDGKVGLGTGLGIGIPALILAAFTLWATIHCCNSRQCEPSTYQGCNSYTPPKFPTPPPPAYYPPPSRTYSPPPLPTMSSETTSNELVTRSYYNSWNSNGSSSPPRSNAIDLIARAMSAPPAPSNGNSTALTHQPRGTDLTLGRGDYFNSRTGGDTWNGGSNSWEAVETRSASDSSQARFFHSQSNYENSRSSTFAALRYESPRGSGYAYSYTARGPS